jgi:hypothetical protein
MGVISILSFLILLAIAGVANAQLASENIDFPGKDYKSFYMDKDFWSDCMDACKKDPKCCAWTYVKPGYQGPKGRCYLKYAIPELVYNKCCVSGFLCHKPTFATTSPLPPAVIGGDYSYQLKMSSGVPPFQFYPMEINPKTGIARVDTSPDQRWSMPPGLHLRKDGLIWGQLQSNAPARYIYIMIQVRDSCPSTHGAQGPQAISKKFYINIKKQP